MRARTSDPSTAATLAQGRAGPKRGRAANLRVMPTGTFEAVEEHIAPAGSSVGIPVARSRGVTDMVRRSADRPVSISTVVLVALLMGGGSGAGINAILGTDRLEDFEARISEVEGAQAEDRRAVRRLLVYQRWNIAATQAQTKAIEDMSKAQGGAVEVNMPPLPGPLDFESVLESEL